MLQQRQQVRFPPIKKNPHWKLLKDVTQPSYRLGAVRYSPNSSKKKNKSNSGTDNDSDYDIPDPGAEILERNEKERQQRHVDYTKEELDRVLKRVDHTLHNYEYSVKSSLIQHGMTREELNSVEHVADVRELEYLLNDSLAKQRYKQRLMVFIVGKTEQVNEKMRLLEQIEQFFNEQRQNFSGAEFNDYDDTGDTTDEVEVALKSFDVKDCFLHVKALINRISELNEDIIQFLIQNTGTKQTKVMVERGKRKLAQVTKEAKEQLADLQSKLEMAHTEMAGKNEKLQALEKDIEVIRAEVKASQEAQKKLQDDLKRREAEVKFFKRKTGEFEEILSRHKTQLGDIPGLSMIMSHSETDDDDASKMNLDTIDETESKYEKESLTSQTTREQAQSSSALPPGLEPTPTATTIKPATGTTPAPPITDDKSAKKVKREKAKRKSIRSKKETTNQSGADDPSEMYRRSQELLESLLADKSDNAPDLNALLKPTRGVDLNNVTIDNLPTAFTNLRKFAIIRVRELSKELETKETTNKETVQILKQEFVEHKTTFEKERLLYFLSLDPDSSALQEEQNALAEKVDNAHQLQLKAQKTAEEALNHLERFMVEQGKLDEQDVTRQTDLVQRHSDVVNQVTGSSISPPDHAGPVDDATNNRSSANAKRRSSSKSQWQRLSSTGDGTPKADATNESKTTPQRKSSNQNQISPPKQVQPGELSEQQQQSPRSPSLRRTAQELLRKKSSEQGQRDRSTASSRRLSVAMNDEFVPLSKVATPQLFDRTPPSQSNAITRTNSMNLTKDHDKLSSAERSYHASAAQSRRVSIGANRSPVRAEELARVLTKLVSEEIEALEDYRRTSVKSRTSLREKYLSLLEEKKHELEDLKQKADMVLSRPTTSNRERRAFDSLDNSRGLFNQQSSISPVDATSPGEYLGDKENRTGVMKQDQNRPTSQHGSRLSSAKKDKFNASPSHHDTQNDQYKLPFYHLYETIYKFRHSIINILEQNQFLSLADRLDMIQQLSTDENNVTNDFVDNSERVLKDTAKVLQTCLTTLVSSSKMEKENTQHDSSSEQSLPSLSMPAVEPDHSSLLQQKESMIEDLTNKYQFMSQMMDHNSKKHTEEIAQNERIINEQQKLIQNLQRDVIRLQKRLSKVENEGIVEPSIMFTRLDAQRNEAVLKQAVDKGKLTETTFNEINGTMSDYVRLPKQQFANIVKRYIQHRKATELEDRIQSETCDRETKSVLERMGSFYERRSGKLSERISSIRQHRTTLARSLTEQFDSLEHESSLFLVRPIYSYQGRAAVQSYMENVKRRQGSLGHDKKKKTQHSRLSGSTNDPLTDSNSREMPTALSSTSASDEEEKLFHIEKTLTQLRPTPASQQSAQNNELITDGTNVDGKPRQAQMGDVPRLQEFDIQRTLMPMAHPNVSLLSANTNDGNESVSSSVNLRSYVALSRPGVGGNVRIGNPNETVHQVSRADLSTLSVASQITNPRTPFNSTVGDLRRTTSPLPPIKRTLTTSVSPPIDEKDSDEFIPSVSANQFSSAHQPNKDDKDEHE